MRCAYLTMDDISGFVSDASMSFAAMRERSWQPEFVPWRGGVDWNEFAAVYICTPWDYQDDAAAFLDVLATIDRSPAVLVNPLSLVHWNLDKRYLRELADGGAPVVPALWRQRFAATDVADFHDRLGSDRIVFKPQVGANSDHVHVLDRGGETARIAASFAERPFFVQAFLPAVQTEGEWSLFYFGGEFSHAIRKLPRAGDFRSQEEHGAEIIPASAPAALVETGMAVLQRVQPAPVYARADFLRGPDGFLLMELELIEPSLYFRCDPQSPARFAAAIDDYVRKQCALQ